MATKGTFGSKMSLFSADDLFLSQAERDNGRLENVRIDEILPFKNHTFKVIDNDEMYELSDSIKEYGVWQPGIAFHNEEGQLELISGHRRMRASELAGVETLPVIIKNVDRDTAIIMMGQTNLQSREKILPSEKAFTYRDMKAAMIRQGKRNDLTSSPVETKLTGKRTTEIIGEKGGDSRAQVDRYIRLTYLIPELLELVDKDIMALRPAVEVSYLDDINQKYIYGFYQDTIIKDDNEKIISNGILPSLSQAKEFKRLYNAGELDEDVIADILEMPKPNQKEKIILNTDKVMKYKGDLTPTQFENKIIKALEFYEKYSSKTNDKENDMDLR